MNELIVEIIVVIIVFTIFILNLIKVIKLFNKDYIVVKAKVKYCRYYIAGDKVPEIDYMMEYKLNNIDYKEKYIMFFGKRENSYINLVVNKIHGNIITTNLTRNVLTLLLLINSIFPIIIICSFLEKVFDFLIL